ncbi:hypothetical protein ACQCN2_15745 [Brevibacillus ginsengisoli]|uniref:hypothetical protein n=1 Tax=Brevibacillus ginsengisoli TaxID=363854 RepID=UPI003CE8862A
MNVTKTEKRWIPNKLERKWVYLSLALAIVIVGWGIWQYSQLPSDSFHTRGFKGIFKNYGSLARITLFAVLAHYVFLFIFQKKWLDPWAAVKKLIIPLAKLARKWHTPVAILSIALIVLHVIGAFLYGIKLNFSNVSGLLALAVLLPVPISGLFRYRRLDKQWHLRFGLGFAVLFLIHAFL